MNKSTLFTTVLGLSALVCAGYGVVGDFAVPEMPAVQSRLDTDDSGRLDKTDDGRLDKEDDGRLDKDDGGRLDKDDGLDKDDTLGVGRI